MAMAKHYVANDQEAGRIGLDTRVSDRVLRELYLRPFQMAVQDGHVASTMCSYNQVNGRRVCQHEGLLSSVLKGEWGFPGFTRSDWSAVSDTGAAFDAGMDWMKSADPAGLAAAVQAGRVRRSRVDDAVHRILREMFAYRIVDHPLTGTFGAVVTDAQHVATARSVAEDATVLLKNDGDLPLHAGTVGSIAVIGPDGGTGAHTAGTGTGHVNAPAVTPFDGITRRAGSGVRVRYAAGLPNDIAGAAKLAASSSVAVVFANDVEAENSDRPNLSLPNNQDALISAVAAANPHTVVVLNTGGPVLMPWLAKVSGVLEAWYPGQEDGNAAAAVLFGDVDPSGKLPVTFPASAAQSPTAAAIRRTAPNNTIVYGEGLDMGYRWYDSHSQSPLFPFGYGGSYTTFRVGNLATVANADGSATVDADVTNTGSRAGRSTLEIFVGHPAAAGEPPHQLGAFGKTPVLAPGAAKHFQLTVPASSFLHWDTTGQRWTGTAGDYTIWAGSSSRNLPLHQTVRPHFTNDPPWLLAYRNSDGSLAARRSADPPANQDRSLGSPAGLGISGPPAVATTANGRTYYVAAGMDHALYVRTTVTGWTRLVASARNHCTQPGAVIAGTQLLFGCLGTGARIYEAAAGIPAANGNPQAPSMSPVAGGVRSGPAMYEDAGTLHLTFLGAPYAGGNTYDRTLTAAGRHLGTTCAGPPAAAAAAGTRWFACRSTAGALEYRHEGVGGPGTGAVGSMTGTPGLAVAATGAQVTASYAGTNHSIYTRLLTRIAVDPSRRSATGTTMEGVAASDPPR
jgi:beta-glucosidase